MADYGWAEGLRDAFQGLGWGSFFGASAQNPALQPGLVQGFLQQQNQPIVFAEERKRALGSMILKGLADGTIDWAQGGPALEKLGYDTRGMPNLWGNMNGPMTGFMSDIAKQQAGGAPGGMQTSPLAPPAPPPTPEETAQAYGAAQAPEPPAGEPAPSGVMRTSTDAQGNTVEHRKDANGRGYTLTKNKAGDVIAMSAQTPDVGVLSTMLPGERDTFTAAQQTLNSPRVTWADINRYILANAKTPQQRVAMTKYAEDIVKQDDERRKAALEQVKALTENARQRYLEQPTTPIDEPVGTDATGRTMYQRYIIDPETRRLKKFGIPAPLHEPMSTNVRVQPFESEATKLSVQQLLGKEGQAELQGAQHTIASLDDMAELNKQGIIGGPLAEPRTWWANMLAPFASADDLDKLSRSAQYESGLRGLLLQLMKTRDLGSGNAISNQDREFIMQMLPRASWDVHARTAIVATMRHYAQYTVDNYNGKQAFMQDQLARGVTNPNLVGYNGSKFQPKLTSYVNTPEAKNLKATLGEVPPTQQPKGDTSKPALDYNELKGRFQPAAPIEPGR